MPNGGIDNCFECKYFNKNNSKNYCTIRKVQIAKPAYTYCNNCITKSKIPVGPIYSSGLHSEKVLYTRIPWHDNNEPRIYVLGKCLICHKQFKGIDIETIDGNKQFCSNKHYLEWHEMEHK